MLCNIWNIDINFTYIDLEKSCNILLNKKDESHNMTYFYNKTYW